MVSTDPSAHSLTVELLGILPVLSHLGATGATAVDRADDGPSTRPGPERMEAHIGMCLGLKASSRMAD
jgi:hypothetical protein